MKVRVTPNPKKPQGFAVQFPYSSSDVENVKKCLGFTYDRPLNAWVSEGPEVLLDMQRFGIEVEWISGEARQVAEVFRRQLWKAMDARKLNIEEEFAYQQQGTDILSAMPNIILGDDMGLGKSKQSLDAAVRIGATSILILCPKTLSANWIQEIAKWQPQLIAGIVPDTKQKTKYSIGRVSFWRNQPNVVIANYEKVRLDDWPLAKTWDVVICDEATKLKTSTTQTYKRVRTVIKFAKATWCLTGTPLEIKLDELYNILGLMRPSVLGHYMRFCSQHVIKDWSGNITGARNLELLRERIAPFLLRRTKKEVLRQLPPKMPINNIIVELTDAEKDAYKQMTSEFDNWLDAHDVSGGDNPLVQTLRFRQFCCTPAIWTDELGRGSKFLMLQDLIHEWPGRILVFTFFEQVAVRLHEWLGCHPDAYISGKVHNDLRIPRVNAFNEGKTGQVFISTDAGGMGLNITGADMIVHYDQLFNPAKMKQREDRLHRIGQTSPVFPVNLLCKNTIDVGMYQLNREREHLFEDVVEGAEEALLKKLDAPRLRRMIEGRLNDERLT